jgi:cell division protein YceG involved in septum cleavage
MSSKKSNKVNRMVITGGGTGGHVFAKTGREHEKNVVKWHKIKRSR